MPRISAFYGVEIYMYFRDHAPPHFHAIYGELEAAVSIQTGDVIEGQLPKTAKKARDEIGSTALAGTDD